MSEAPEPIEKPLTTAAVIRGTEDVDAYIATMTVKEALYWAGSLVTGFAGALEYHFEIGEDQLRASGALQLRTAQKLLIRVAEARGGFVPADHADPGFGQLLERVVQQINQAQVADRGES